MPNPKTGESKETYVQRYMSSEEAKRDYPDEKQRLAVAYSEWTNYEKACATKPVKKEDSQHLQISKYRDDGQLVFGWASVAKDANGVRPLDWQGDLIDAEDLEQAVYKFNTDFRESNDMHRANSVNGTLVESIMFTKDKVQAMGIPEGVVPEGWWVGFKIDDPVAYSKVKSGIYKMFSIEGSAQRVPCADESVINHEND